jgi:hypothetical protein
MEYVRSRLMLVRVPNVLIGIGAPDHYTGDPCHTTRHAGPHRAVREVEVACPAGDTHLVEVLAPERSYSCIADSASSLRFPVGASPLFASGSSSFLII